VNWFRQHFSRRRRYHELSQSIREHLDETIEELVDNGMSREEAARAARRQFGNVALLEERSREVWQWPTVESVWADLQYALRQLRRSPGFTIVSLLTLALGIGANTAVYSIIQSVLLHPLPYHDPNRLMLLADKQDPQEGGVLYKDYQTWTKHTSSFTGIAAYYRDSGWSRVTLTGGQEPQSFQGAYVTANFFSLLGVAPLLGRTFTTAEENGHERVIVLSYGLWKRQFGRSPDVAGQELRIDGVAAKVIGVMPETFQFPAADSRFWAPITTNRYWGDPAVTTNDGAHSGGFYARWQAIARLKEGVSPQQAQADLDAVFSGLQETDADPNRGIGITVIPLRIQIAGDTRLALYVLFGSVCMLLLIACSNVTNLVLARSASRVHEMALRAALGAGRGRIVQQLLTESFMLAILGGLISLLFALLGIRALTAMGPRNIPRLSEAGLNAGVLGFTFAVALLSAILFGLTPAVKVWRRAPNEQLKAMNITATGTIGFASMRSVLIVVEFALSVLLLTGAGLLIHSFLLVRSVDPGFEPEHVLNIHVTFPGGTSGQQISTISDSIVHSLQAIPGVKSVGAIEGIFDFGPTNNIGLRSIEGRSPEPRQQWTALNWNTVREDYFQAMGAELLRGRYFNQQDGPSSPLAAIIDESMARRYWKGEDPIGKRIKGQDRRGHNDDWVTVIGVVGDIRTHGLERAATPHVYEWYRQTDNPTPDIVVRATGNPAAIASVLRSVVRTEAPTAILSSVTTVQQQLSQQLAPRRFQTFLLGVFSLLALVLATVGIYGLIHYSVVQRTREIGIRMALGAQRADILLAVIKQGMLLAGIGLGIGLMVDWPATRLLSRLLYGVAPSDPITLSAVSLLLMGAALLASLIPALRAVRVDPMQTLRSE
jgi:macrolide transport system ATP-binding/permease protein